MKTRYFKLLAAGLSVIATLLMMEIGVRIFDAARGRSSNARTSWYWMFQQDPFLGYRGRPSARTQNGTDSVIHNADGFRDSRDLSEIARMTQRRLVVCVGESSTYGVSAGRNEDTYPARLEAELRAASDDDRWVVFNAGVPGYTSHEILELVKLRLLKLQPEIIVTMNLRNDHEFIARYLDDRQDYNLYPLRLAQLSATPINDLLMRSSLFGLVASRLRYLYQDDLGGRPPPLAGESPTDRGLRLYLDDLAMLELLCSRAGIRLMAVDQPVDTSGYDEDSKRGLEAMRLALRQASAEGATTLLEAQSRLDWTGLTPQDDVHLGALGYRRLAALLAPQILAASSSPGGPAGDPRPPAH